MAIPSETAMVEKTRPTPPASATPLLARSASSGPVKLHGVTSFPADTTPTCGLVKSSSSRPTARSIALAAARAGPSVTSRERSLSVISPGSYGDRPKSSHGEDLSRLRHRHLDPPRKDCGRHRVREPGPRP